MKKTSLVVLAAGMGSRYGGLKQIDPIGPNGEIILELSVFDAKRAGFDEVIFIIKEAIEKDFKEAIGNKIAEHFPVKYVFQDMTKIPEGCSIPEGREKPWGTGHALLCCEDVIDAPFCVINADDYYGQEAFVKIHDFLVNNTDEDNYAMVGYLLQNTVSDNGSVARGVCNVENNKLSDIQELTSIEKREDGHIFYTEDAGTTYHELDPNRLVSLNFWGFNPNFIQYMKEDFVNFFKEEVPSNLLKSEFFIPKEVGKMVRENKVSVDVLSSSDSWYGVTYQEDKPKVKAGIKKLIDEGKYPVPLWSK